MIDFDWQKNAPHSRINADNFSVRWTGKVTASKTGDYKFETVSDDGVRLWVNNSKIIDNWTKHSVTTNTSNKVSLVAGKSYPIKVEYFDAGGGAVIRLRWKPPGSSSATTIPEANLLPQ